MNRRLFLGLLALTCVWHVALFLILERMMPQTPTLSEPRKVRVHTVKLSPPKKQIINKPITKAKSTPKPKKQTTPRKKKTTTKKTPTPRRKTQKRTQNKELAALLKKVQQSLDSLEEDQFKKTDTPTTKTRTPLQILPEITSSTNSEGTVEEDEYHAQLAFYLKHSLRLPELGAVRLRLTLDRHGNITNLVIISSESVRNREYILATLPNLTAPTFGQSFKGKSRQTFPITVDPR